MLQESEYSGLLHADMSSCRISCYSENPKKVRRSSKGFEANGFLFPVSSPFIMEVPSARLLFSSDARSIKMGNEVDVLARNMSRLYFLVRQKKINEDKFYRTIFVCLGRKYS